MDNKNILDKAMNTTRLICASDEFKVAVYRKYGLLAKCISNQESIDKVQNELSTYKLILAQNIAKWLYKEKGRDAYKKAISENALLVTVFSSLDNLNKFIDIAKTRLKISVTDNVMYEELVDSINTQQADDVISDKERFKAEEKLNNKDKVEATEESAETQSEEEVEGYVEGYNDKLHGGYKRQIQELFLSAWGSLYGYHVDGQEIINGFIVPGETILGTGETIKYQGVLKIRTDKIEVIPNTLSNSVWEEFVDACKACGIPIVKTVANDKEDIAPFKYNPMFQRFIASGAIDKKAFKGGWESYSQSLKPYIEKLSKELAVTKLKTNSDEKTYEVLSGYTTSLSVVNYKDGLGTQIRFCCGDTSKTEQVANTLVNRLKAREKTHKAIAQGKLILGKPTVSSDGLTGMITLYQNMEGYQSVPQFMGELLCNLPEGRFKPSLKNMIIGVDLDNNIVTAPFTKWLLPIIASSRSGKGVLTLNMLLNVIGGGTPLFYLDGKPDMAALLWGLQEKYNIPNSMVVDGIGTSGITDIDHKKYKAPYADTLTQCMKSSKSNEILEDNSGVMIYLKTMMCILLGLTYYKEQMDNKYGEIFVVFDEMFKVMKIQLSTLVANIDSGVAKLDKNDKEGKAKLNSIKEWVTDLLQDYIGKDIGVFGAGIKAVALTQFAQAKSYSIPGFSIGEAFSQNFLLKRGVKLFGRQEGGTGIYGVGRDTGDSVNFDLYDKYFHFGIGSEQGNTFNNLKTFKPLLVLNESDSKEMTGNDTDGAFTSVMLDRVAKYSDVDEFREKYFKGDKELAESIGFEGALAEVGRLLGVDWQDMLKQSLSRAYEIVDKALRYYGIIGASGITNVYEYVCSCDVDHLWSYNKIIKSKTKGVSLETGVAQAPTEKDGKSSDTFLFREIPEEPTEEGQDEETIGRDKQLNNSIVNDTPTDSLFGGEEHKLSKEEQAILDSILNKDESVKEDVEPLEEKEDTEPLEEKEEQTEAELESETVSSVPWETQDSTVEEPEQMKREQDNGQVNVIDREQDTEEKEEQSTEYEFKNPVNASPDEIFNDGSDANFTQAGGTGRRIKIKPSEFGNNIRMTDKNSIRIGLSDYHPLEMLEKGLMKTIKGANYEFSKRWEAILSGVTTRINKDVVTRVFITADEMYVNGKLVLTNEVLGGFENVRLEDIVNFGVMFKKFRNITEITLDSVMLERFRLEKSNLPEGFFQLGAKLLSVSILKYNGNKELITRGEALSQKAQKEVNENKFMSQFETLCASKNNKLKDKGSSYNTKVWNMTKSFGQKSIGSIKGQVRKKNPSYFKATAIGVGAIGLCSVGAAVVGIGKLFSLFRKK